MIKLDLVDFRQKHEQLQIGPVVSIPTFDPEGQRFESMKGYIPDGRSRRMRETTGEFVPHCKPRYRAVATSALGINIDDAVYP